MYRKELRIENGYGELRESRYREEEKLERRLSWSSREGEWID